MIRRRLLRDKQTGRPEELGASYVPAAIAARACLEKPEVVPKALFLCVEELSGRRFTHARDRWSVRPATAEESALLELPPGTTVVHLVHTARGRGRRDPRSVRVGVASGPDCHPGRLRDRAGARRRARTLRHLTRSSPWHRREFSGRDHGTQPLVVVAARLAHRPPLLRLSSHAGQPATAARAGPALPGRPGTAARPRPHPSAMAAHHHARDRLHRRDQHRRPSPPSPRAGRTAPRRGAPGGHVSPAHDPARSGAPQGKTRPSRCTGCGSSRTTPSRRCSARPSSASPGRSLDSSGRT